MNKLNIVYLGSIIVAIFLISMIFRSILYQPSYDLTENETVIRHSLVEMGDSAIIQFRITNKEGRDINYTIQVFGVQPERRLVTPVRNGYSTLYNFFVDGEKNVSILISKDENQVPIENIQYHISKKEG